MNSENKHLWHGRFESKAADDLMAYTESINFDRRLWLDDITGSRAHVRMLGHVGLLSINEVDAIIQALATVENEIASGEFRFIDSDEDIHTAIERRVTEIAGAAGAKLHTARSRNDQVATALRLWTKRELGAVCGHIADLCRVLRDKAETAGFGPGATYLPGYTHLQRAQPVLLSHHLLAHGWAFMRDIERLHDAIKRLNVSPLGAGALAGTSLPIDPEFTAMELGFAKSFDNSLDAVSDRDFVAESLSALALVGIHLSRLGEEWVLWTTEEFGFAKLNDAWATGSSMLPQKKNPDIAELARGKSGRLIGNLTGFLATMKSLPLAYNRDLQEDKEPLFDAVDQVRRGLIALSGMISTASFNSERMQQAADQPTMAATDLAEYLVRRGVPFRESHAIVGAMVRKVVDEGADLGDLVAASEHFADDALELLKPGLAVDQRSSRGAAGPHAVPDQVARYDAELKRVTVH